MFIMKFWNNKRTFAENCQKIWWRITHFVSCIPTVIPTIFGLECYKVNAKKISHGKFCDYCKCKGCQTGCDAHLIKSNSYLCEDGSYICSVCYYTEPCFDEVKFSKPRSSVFCVHHPKCSHKPKLVEIDIDV